MRHDAINNLYPEVHNQIDNECFDIKGNPVTVDEDKVKTEIARLQTEYKANEYQRSRALEYPSIADQLDEIFHNGIDSWKAIIKQTKDKYPKG